jgi:eukaryotic-like serine/threonine-protein kinase
MRHFRGFPHQGAMHASKSSFDIDTQPFELLSGGDVYCPVCGDAFSPLIDRCPDDGSQLIKPYHPADRTVGKVIDDRYRMMRPLGEGAMGIVYEAVDLYVKRPVAIKVVREELGRDITVTQRFLREARLLTSLLHPNIVEVFDYGETETGSLYLVMELLRGNTLDAILVAERAFSPERTCDIGIQLCDALAAAHAGGVVHRDLKPANVVLIAGVKDWVKILDFGLAKSIGEPSSDLTMTGAVIGTPLYMSPEAIRSDAPDPRSDLYALGCILYEMLAGRPPFSGSSSALVLAKQLDDVPEPLSIEVPAELRKLVNRLLAKTPLARPPSALDVRIVLESCLSALAAQGKS